MKTPTFAIPPYDEHELVNLLEMKCWLPAARDPGLPKGRRSTIWKYAVKITKVTFLNPYHVIVEVVTQAPYAAGDTMAANLSEIIWGPEEDPLAMAVRKAQHATPRGNPAL